MKIDDSVYKVIFARKPRFIGRKIRRDGNFYLGISSVKPGVISLNMLAGEICTSCDSIRTIGDIYIDLKTKYADVCEHTIAYDLCKCVSDLERLGMLFIAGNEQFYGKEESHD